MNFETKSIDLPSFTENQPAFNPRVSRHEIEVINKAIQILTYSDPSNNERMSFLLNLKKEGYCALRNLTLDDWKHPVTMGIVIALWPKISLTCFKSRANEEPTMDMAIHLNPYALKYASEDFKNYCKILEIAHKPFPEMLWDFDGVWPESQSEGRSSASDSELKISSSSHSSDLDEEALGPSWDSEDVLSQTESPRKS